MKLNVLLKFRYLFLIVVSFLLISSAFFMIAGAVECVQGFIEFTKSAFKTTETQRPGVHLLEGLDYFVSALVFMIFGLGFGQLFLFDEISSDLLPFPVFILILSLALFFMKLDGPGKRKPE